MPVKVNARISKAERSLTVTLAKVVPVKVTVPVKLLPTSFTLILWAACDAVKVELPVITNAPVLVMLPKVAVAANVPVAVDAPKSNPLASITDTFTPLNETAPVKLFALSRVTLNPGAATLVVPVIASTPV